MVLRTAGSWQYQIGIQNYSRPGIEELGQSEVSRGGWRWLPGLCLSPAGDARRDAEMETSGHGMFKRLLPAELNHGGA